MSDANTESEGKRQVAKHYFLAADGSQTKDIHEATGCGYTDVETGETVERQIPNAVAGSPQTMWAAFGMKTKFTNDASQIRQQIRAGESPEQTQVEAITESADKILEGVWREPSEGRVGAKVDRDALSQAIVEVFKTGKSGPLNVGEIRQRLDDDNKFFRAARANTKVSEVYSRLTGQEKKAADLGAML